MYSAFHIMEMPGETENIFLCSSIYLDLLMLAGMMPASAHWKRNSHLGTHFLFAEELFE